MYSFSQGKNNLMVFDCYPNRMLFIVVFLLFCHIVCSISSDNLSDKPLTFIKTIGGTGSSAVTNDGYAASTAAIGSPSMMWLDTVGNLFISQPTFHRIRRIDANDSRIHTFIGTGVAGLNNENGPISSTQLYSPMGIWGDSLGNYMYVAENNNHRIRRVDIRSKTIETIAGYGYIGYSGFKGDKGPATMSWLSSPYSVAIDTLGNLYVSDYSNSRIRKLTRPHAVTYSVTSSNNVTTESIVWPDDYAFNYTITTVAGTTSSGYYRDNITATSSQAYLSYPLFSTVDRNGNILIADSSNHRIRVVVASTNKIFTIAGTGNTNYNGDGMLATVTNLYTPTSLWLSHPFDTSAESILYLYDGYHYRVRAFAYNPDNPMESVVNASIMMNIAGAGYSGHFDISMEYGKNPLNVPLGFSRGIAGDPIESRYLYVSDQSYHIIWKIDLWIKLIFPYAGTSGTANYGGDGGLAYAAYFNSPNGLWVDSIGDVYVADTNNHRIRKITNFESITNSSTNETTITSIVSTIAGIGLAGLIGDGGDAKLSRLYSPFGVTGDHRGNIYVADSTNHRVRIISAPVPVYDPSSGSTTNVSIIKTIAGSGQYGLSGFNGDNLRGTSTMLWFPYAVFGDSAGDSLYFTDRSNYRIRKLDLISGIVATVAGNSSSWGYIIDNVPALKSKVYPSGLWLDPTTGDIYYTDTILHRVRKIVRSTGLIQNIAGTANEYGYNSEDGQLAINAHLYNPLSVWGDTVGNIWVADSTNGRVRKIDKQTGIIYTALGTGLSGLAGFNGDKALASMAYLSAPYSIVLQSETDDKLSFLFADLNNYRIRRLSMTKTNVDSMLTNTSSFSITTIAGTGVNSMSGDGAAATSTTIYAMFSIYESPLTNDLYFVEQYYYRIRKVSAVTNEVTTVIGTGIYGFSGDGTPVSSANLMYPVALWIHPNNTLYFSDSSAYRVRYFDLNNVTFNNVTMKETLESFLYTLIGDGTSGNSGDGGFASHAQIGTIRGMYGNDKYLWISDNSYHVIRKVDLQTNIVTRVAGSGNAGYNGDNQPATSAYLYSPYGIWVNSIGDLFIADSNNHRIRKVEAGTGLMRTIAGTGTAGLMAESGIATSLRLYTPTSVVGDRSGNIYFTDVNNHRIRMIVNSTSSVSRLRKPMLYTIAGARSVGVRTYAGDNGPISSAQLNNLFHVITDTIGNLYIADRNNHRVRKTFGLYFPTSQPTSQPSNQPISQPSRRPTSQPTSQPSSQPFCHPTSPPSAQPSEQPSKMPISAPTSQPSSQPLLLPTGKPSVRPVGAPTSHPSSQPSVQPSLSPTSQPSSLPTHQPFALPSTQPTNSPTNQPSHQPSAAPSIIPSNIPSSQPSASPTSIPSRCPSSLPTVQPTHQPSLQPSSQPSHQPTDEPSSSPTSQPSFQPSSQPTNQPSCQPSFHPSSQPTQSPTARPSKQPSSEPTHQPTRSPSHQPTSQPSEKPSHQPSSQPSSQPLRAPTCQPSGQPSWRPSSQPSVEPSKQPISIPSNQPTSQPSMEPSKQPISIPSNQPTSQPLSKPSAQPSRRPTAHPTCQPSNQPSRFPSANPSKRPSSQPSSCPTSKPSTPPTSVPTPKPTPGPSFAPTIPPTVKPSMQPQATFGPTLRPTTAVPSEIPSALPSILPTVIPTQASKLELLSATMNGLGNIVTVSMKLHGSLDTIFSKNNTAGSFVCSAMLTFTDSNIATCVVNFQSSINSFITISISVPSGSSFHVGEVIGYQYSYAVVERSEVVPSSSQPSVSGIVPAALPACSNLNMDFSSTSGQLSGKQWYNVSISIIASQNQTQADVITSYLSATYFPFSTKFFKQPVSVPSIYLLPGVKDEEEDTYTISIQVCNILLLCDAKSFVFYTSSTLTSSPPITSIAGNSVRSITRATGLTLYSTLYVPLCGTEKRTSGLIAQWSVFEIKDNVKVLTSSYNSTSSSSGSKLYLAPNTLPSNSRYVIELAGFDTVTKLKSQIVSAVVINVAASSLVVSLSPLSITGGKTQLLRVGNNLVVDASTSFDPDDVNPGSSTSALRFTWYCRWSNSPLCPLSMNRITINGINDVGLRLTANSTAFNTTSLIILTVSAGVTGRNSSISFMVQVIGAEAPLISFTTPASSVSNVNTANRLTLLASVQTLSSCSAIWSVNDSSIMIEMRSSAYALTPLSVFVSGSSSVNLVLSGNLLQAGSNYVFSLTCGGSTGKIVVTTNNIPQSGVYMVSPSEGVELSTSFSFTTSQWVDSDLPLSYQFSFVSPTSATDMTIRGKSELTTTSSTLPSGSASQGFGLNTTATVYDVLGASNRLVQRVLVTMLSTAEVQSRLTDQLSVLSFSSSSSSDAVSAEDITNLIAIASTAMNRVDCSGAPVCNTLYRAECQSTSATCGSCLLGYVGEAGDANSACISEAILLQAVSSPSSSSSGERTTCKKDSDCLGWQRCSSVQYCEDRNKTCLNDCNSALSQGQCHFYAGVTPSTKRLLSSCSMLAPSSECYAECLCRSGYDGEDCSMTAKALEGNQNLRAKLLDGLSLVVSSDGNDVGVSASSVSSSISSFQSIIRNDFDLPSPSKSGSGLASADVLSTSLEIVSGIFNQAFSVIDGSGTSSLSYQSTESILSPLESTVSKVLQISDNKSMTVNMIDSFVQSIDTFGDIVVSGQVAGEDAYTYIGDVFRLIHKEVQLGADGDSTDSIASLKLPRSTTEKLRGSSPPMVVSINSSSNVVNGDLYLQAIEYDASLWSQTNQSAALLVAKTLNNGTGFSSNSTSSVSVTFLSNIVQLKAPLSLSTLTITVPITTSQTSDLGQNVTFVCLTGDYDKKSFACAESGVIVEYQCTGVAGRITKYCPILAPSCRSVSWTDQTISASDADSCIVVHSTSSNITCECSLGRSARRVIRGRRLVDTSEDGILYESGVLTMVAMASYTAIGVTETFAAADDMDSLQDVEKTILIMAMFAALWSTGGLVLLVVWWKRNDDVKKEERLLEKKGIQINDLDGKEGNGSSAVAPIQVGRGRERSGAVGVKTRTVAKIQPTSELSPSASKGVIDAVKAKRVIDNLRHYIDSVVPPVYLSPSFLARLKGELLRHHSYLNVFFGLENSSDYSSRGRLPWIPVFHLLTIQTMLIFLLAVLYDLQYPSSPEERQKCYSYVTKAECLKQKSLFDSSETFCQWMTVSFAASGSTSGEECIFVEPDLTLEVTLYCAVISSVFTAIVLRPLNYLFTLLSAPSEEGIKASIAAASVIRKLQNQVRRASLVAMNQVNQFASILPGMNGDKKVENSGKKGHQFTARFIPPETNVAYKEAKAAVLSLAAAGSGGDDIWQTRVVKRLTQRTVLNNKQPGQAKLNTGNSFTSAVFNFDSLEESIFLQRENFVSLVKQNTIDDLVITKQRQLLKRFIQVYDRQWGLKQDVVGSHADSQTVDTLTKVASSDIRQRKHIRIGIQGELVHVAKSAQEVIDKLHSNATDTHIGIEVIQLFIQDLLGRDTAAAKIFRSKLEEDYSHLPVVKRRVKILITILLVLINAFFIYFTLLRGFERGFKWQQSFVMGCVVQIVVEMCLYETMECLWINVFIPNLVTKEVHGICQVLRDTIDHLGKTFLTSAAPLNATKGVVANDRRGSEAKTDDDSGDLNKQSAINDNIDGFLLNVPDYLFISSRIAKEFPSLLESAIVLSYTTCLPGEMRRNWHRNTGHTTHSTGSKTTWSISGQLVQWFILATANVSAFFLYFIANVPFDIQRMFIRFVQPFIYGGMLVLWYTIESSLWLEVTFLAVCSLVVAGLIAGYYRGKAGMVVPTSSRDLGDEEDDEDDESVNIGVMDHIIEKDLNLNLLFQSTESFAQRVELNVTAKNAPALNQVKEQQHEGSSSSSSVASKSLSSDDDDSDFHDEDIQSFESLSFSGIDENSSIAQSSATMDIIYLTPEEEVEHDHTRETMLKRRTRTRSKSSRSRLSSFESMGV